MAISRPMALVLLGLTSGPLLGTARAYVIPPEPLIDVSTWVNDRGPVTVVQMSLRQSGRGAESHDSLSCAVSELGNLTSEQVAGPQRDVRFELVRDAGVLTPDFVRRVNAGARAPVPMARLVDLRIQGRQP